MKHLITLAAGALPSFIANDQSESTAPVRSLQKVFIDSYRVDYLPTLMTTQHLFTEIKDSIIYYSLNQPTLCEIVPKTSEITNIMYATKEIQNLFEALCRAIQNGSLEVERKFYSLLNKRKFEFIHTSYDSSKKLIFSNNLSQKDPHLITLPNAYPNMNFCHSSAFWRGAIRIIVT